MSAYQLGHIVGTLFVIILPIAIGYAVSLKLAARRECYNPVRWPIVVGCVVSGLVLLGQCSTAHAQPQLLTEGDETVVVQSRIVGSRPLFDNTVKNVGEYNAGVRRGNLERAQERGIAVEPASINIDTVLTRFDNEAVLKTRTAVQNVSFTYTFFGASGKDAVLVICTSRTSQQFDPDKGVCGRAVRAAFGVPNG